MFPTSENRDAKSSENTLKHNPNEGHDNGYCSSHSENNRKPIENFASKTVWVLPEQNKAGVVAQERQRECKHSENKNPDESRHLLILLFGQSEN
jgi:hypothetical protein